MRQNDTAILIQMKPVFIFGGKTKAKANATRKMYSRLIYNLKIVYPIAQEANATLKAMERRMAELPTEKEKQEFVKGMERALKRQYTPVLKNMTLSQGKLLIKLIDAAGPLSVQVHPHLIRSGQTASGRIPSLLLARDR